MDIQSMRLLAKQLTIIQMATEAALAVLLEDGHPDCTHDRKQDMTTMGGPEHWVCQDCGYEYEEES